MQKKNKLTKAAFLRGWGLPKTFQYRSLRYKTPPEKGVYWYYISLFVRKRDVEKYGVCISCGKPITVETSNAGHFMPASSCGRDLLFYLRNLNAECPHCNAWDETHLLGYAENLDKRYGKCTADALRSLRATYLDGDRVKDWTAKEYAQKIIELGNYPQEVLDFYNENYL